VTSRVLGELLEHEARHWQRTAAAAGLSGDGRVLNAVVAALVVAGADDEDQAAAVAGRVPDLAGLADGEPHRWGQWLAGLYPGAGAGMGSVQPDLLAEQHAVTELAADPVLARAVLSGLEGRQAVRALTVLGRAWDLYEEAGPVIGAALRADLAGLAAAAGQVTGERTRTSSGTERAAPSMKAAMPVRMPAKSSPGGVREKRLIARGPLRSRRRPMMPPST